MKIINRVSPHLLKCRKMNPRARSAPYGCLRQKALHFSALRPCVTLLCVCRIPIKLKRFRRSTTFMRRNGPRPPRALRLLRAPRG